VKKICYAVAASLDGYIAGPKGEADWIIIDPEMDFGELFERFDTVLMGRRTFVPMEKMGQGPMSAMETFVFSHARTRKTSERDDAWRQGRGDSGSSAR
jgi:dihydrofolate reductase